MLILAALLAAATPAQPAPSPQEIVDSAPATDWPAIPVDDLLIMDLAPDAAGHARRVVIQLLPAPFSQGWIGNIRKLAAAHWWDGTAINRVQDNYVVQWGDPNEDDPKTAKALPAGLAVVPEREYVARKVTAPAGLNRETGERYYAGGLRVGFDDYGLTQFWHGWPIGLSSDPSINLNWPVHCYGMVGVGRNLPPDTGSGAELYAVIGTPPRQLDRNIALVGRVIEGMEYLSSLPRGHGPMGFYQTAPERTPIRAIHLASELPTGDQPRFQYLDTESATFARYADARANRRDPFYILPAGGVDICNVPVPIRRAP